MIFIAENDYENELAKQLAEQYGGKYYTRENAYGLTVWSVEDVKEVSELSDEEAREFLDLYEDKLGQGSVTGGWAFLENADYSEIRASEQEVVPTVDLSNAAAIEYKGVVFDDWTVDEETGGIWGEMCQDCADKYRDVLVDELSDGGMGSCSVKGCDVVGADSDNERHYYVDFKPELIKIIPKVISRAIDGSESLEDKIVSAEKAAVESGLVGGRKSARKRGFKLLRRVNYGID